MKKFKEYLEELEDTIEEHLKNRGIEFLYHGTNIKYKNNIDREGLKKGKENYDQSKDGVYLTTSRDMAIDWAMDAFENDGIEEDDVFVYEIPVSKLNLNKLVADINIEFEDAPDNFIYKGTIKV